MVKISKLYMHIYGNYDNFYPKKLIFFDFSKNYKKAKNPTYYGPIISKIGVDLCFNATNVPAKFQSIICAITKVITVHVEKKHFFLHFFEEEKNCFQGT